jgi:peptidoglycan biosynthesis protein MviN/MurJ (putative lipid II flippase)
MTPADVDAVGAVFSVGVWALPGILLTTVWQQIMYAHGNTRLPLFTNILLAACVVPACWLGKMIGGLEGVAFMYALIYVLPVLWLSYDGLKQGMIARYVPSRAYHTMTLAILLAWLPMAFLFHSLALPAIGGLVLAVVIGTLTLLAGAYTFQPARQWLMRHLNNRS